MVITIAVVILVAVAVLLLIYNYSGSAAASLSSTSSNLVSNAVDGKTQLDSNVEIPLANNQQEGLTFSYAAWVRIEDFAYRYGEEKVIFVKGPTDLSSMCPGVFLDANTNTILVKLDTFGAREIVTISNITAKKWFHIAVAVDQDSMDVYINGIVHTHKSISQLPRQNPSGVHVGIGGGFDGKIGSLNYYNYFLKPADVSSIMGSPPNVTPEIDNSTNYQDISFWTRS